MAKSNKPIVWGLFAAGGTLTAFLMPALIVLTLLAALSHVPDALSYARLHGFAAHGLGKLVLIAFVVLSLWHAAHRLRVTLHDFGVRADTLVALSVYAIAAWGSIATMICVARI
jgi:fumarate reductase subunit D